MPDIEVYSGPGCTYCAAAKKLLSDRGLEWREHDVSDPAIADRFREQLPRVRAIPQIFIDGEHIGGYEDLRLMVDRNDARLSAQSD